MRNSLLLLSEFSDVDVQWFQQVGEQVFLKEGQVLIAEEKPIQSIYILLDGSLQVKVKVPNQPDQQRTVARLTTGEVIGEMSFVDHHSPSATVIAETDSVLLEVSQKLLKQRIEENLDFGKRFYQGLAYCLSNRLRLMNVSFPQAGIEINGMVPSGIENEEVIANLPKAKMHLESLLALVNH